MKPIQSQQEWLHDISWNWDGTSTTRGKAGSRLKLKTYTLTMTHNPTGIRVMSSTHYVPNKREITQITSSKLWSDLFAKIQTELANRGSGEELKKGEQVVAPNRSLSPSLKSTSSVRGLED